MIYHVPLKHKDNIMRDWAHSDIEFASCCNLDFCRIALNKIYFDCAERDESRPNGSRHPISKYGNENLSKYNLAYFSTQNAANYLDKTAKKVVFFENKKGLTGKNGKEMNFALYADYQWFI